MAAKKPLKLSRNYTPQYPLLVKAILQDASNNVTYEHAHEMQNVMRENNERCSDRKLISWLADNAMDLLPAEYELLGAKDSLYVQQRVKQLAKDLIR